VNREKLDLNNDSFISIFTYVIAKSGVEDLASQMRLIREFTSDYVRNISKMGNTLLTVESALKRISALDGSRLNDRNYLANAIVELYPSHGQDDTAQFKD